HGESCGASPHDKKAGEVDTVEVLRIEEEIGNAEVGAEASGHHGKENDPAQQQHVVPLHIVYQQLNRKGVANGRKNGRHPAHEQYYPSYLFLLMSFNSSPAIYAISRSYPGNSVQFICDL